MQCKSPCLKQSKIISFPQQTLHCLHNLVAVQVHWNVGHNICIYVCITPINCSVTLNTFVQLLVCTVLRTVLLLGLFRRVFRYSAGNSRSTKQIPDACLYSYKRDVFAMVSQSYFILEHIFWKLQHLEYICWNVWIPKKFWLSLSPDVF